MLKAFRKKKIRFVDFMKIFMYYFLFSYSTRQMVTCPHEALSLAELEC